MKRWLHNQNAYSIIKLMSLLIVLYNFVSSFVFAMGGKTYLGGYFSGTSVLYVAIILITFTPKGKVYFSVYFRFLMFILLISNQINMMFKFLEIGIRQRYAVVCSLLIFGIISYLLGALITHTLNERKKKSSKSSK